MTEFNLSRYLSSMAAKGDKADDGHIDARLEKSRSGGKPPESLTEEQLSEGYRGKEGETITEERLENVRTGSGDALVEGMLNASKSKLVKHRNEEASAGDINKLEEQRVASKKRQEAEEQEPSSETGKKNRLLDTDTSGDDGLRLAGPRWQFTRSAIFTGRDSPDAKYYCVECGMAYTDLPQECGACGGSKLLPNADAVPPPGWKDGIPLDMAGPQPAAKANPNPKGIGKYRGNLNKLNPGKMMPRLQESTGKRVVTAQWDFDEDMGMGNERAVRDILESDDPTSLGGGSDDLSPEVLRDLRDPKFDVHTDEDPAAEQDAQATGEDKPVFEESVVGRSSVTGTKMEIVEIACPDMSSYENDVGQLDKRSQDRMVADIMAFLATEHPEMKGNLTSKMLNLSKVMDGKVFYLRPV